MTGEAPAIDGDALQRLLDEHGRHDGRGWRDHLTRAAAPEGTRLHGLLVLVPGRDREQRPVVDGAPIRVVTAGQWVRVPTAWLDRAAA